MGGHHHHPPARDESVEKSDNSVDYSSPIPQLDGNVSFLSESEISSVKSDLGCVCCDILSDCDPNSDEVHSDDEHSDEELPIAVLQPWVHGVYSNPPAWYEQYRPTLRHNTARINNITVKRNNKQLEGISLPVISVSNLRSLTPKLYSFKNDMIQREISVSLCSEVWEKANCKKQQFEIEKMLQMEGLKYISTPRTTKRGGGAAIIVNTEKFSLEKIQVEIPFNLEVVWGLLRPKKVTSKIREIILCAFYSPPKS